LADGTTNGLIRSQRGKSPRNSSKDLQYERQPHP
jgi:hypothetical protein